MGLWFEMAHRVNLSGDRDNLSARSGTVVSYESDQAIGKVTDRKSSKRLTEMAQAGPGRIEVMARQISTLRYVQFGNGASQP